MSRPIIAVDIDDVLSSENEAMRLFINERYGQNHTPEDYLIDGEYWSYWDKVWGVDKQTARKWFNSYLDANVKAKHQLIDGALDSISALQNRYDLVIITSREDRMVDVTHQWLNRHFPKVFSKVEFVRLWQKKDDHTKGTIAREVGADYIIDDNVEHCNASQAAGVQALLFGDYGWNRQYTPAPGVVRVKNWQAVRDYFNV
jgi:uncharacterized HAD superfamily protein